MPWDWVFAAIGQADRSKLWMCVETCVRSSFQKGIWISWNYRRPDTSSVPNVRLGGPATIKRKKSWQLKMSYTPILKSPFTGYMNIVEVYFSSIFTKFHPSHIHLLYNFHQFSYIVCKKIIKKIRLVKNIVVHSIWWFWCSSTFMSFPHKL